MAQWAVISDANGRVGLVGDSAPSVRQITTTVVNLMGFIEPVIVTFHDTLESADNHANSIGA